MRRILFALIFVITCCGSVWSFTPGTDSADTLIASAVIVDGSDQREVLRVDSLLLRNAGNLNRNVIGPAAADTPPAGKIDPPRGADRLAASPVPEPVTMLLLGAGLVGLAGLSRKTILKKA